MATQQAAYLLLQNASLIPAVIESYKSAWGDFLWPVLFLATLGLVYLKTESPVMVALASIFGNVLLLTLLPGRFHLFFYGILAFSIAILFYAVIGRKD